MSEKLTLDEEVFETVYGFSRLRDDQLPPADRGKEVWLNFCATPEAGEMHTGPCPAFSTDPAVNERIIRDSTAAGWEWEIIEPIPGTWQATVAIPVDFGVRGHLARGTGRTRAEAVCVTCLKALSDEEVLDDR